MADVFPTPVPHGFLPADTHAHAIVAGASGMLRAATLALARTGWRVTAIARDAGRLGEMTREAAEHGGTIVPMALDLRDAAALRERLAAFAGTHGSSALTIAWLHADALDALAALAEVTRGRFVHVMGCAAEDPAAPSLSFRHHFESPELRWHEVVLGFVHGREGSRWLTNEEISSGVLTAIGTGEPRTIVGTVRPWSARP